MRRATFAIGILLCTWQMPGFGTENADVLPGTLYRCETPTGNTIYTNAAAGGNKQCVILLNYLAINKVRPGLTGWRPFYRDSNLALLIYDDRTVVRGKSASSWIMYSLAVPSLSPIKQKPYSRAVAKVTADCEAHNLDTSTIQYWQVTGSQTVAVEIGVGGHEEVAPNTSEDLLVMEVCKGPPKKDKGPHGR